MYAVLRNVLHTTFSIFAAGVTALALWVHYQTFKDHGMLNEEYNLTIMGIMFLLVLIPFVLDAIKLPVGFSENNAFVGGKWFKVIMGLGFAYMAFLVLPKSNFTSVTTYTQNILKTPKLWSWVNVLFGIFAVEYNLSLRINSDRQY